ncbi:MAG: Rv1355c family protein [Chloroflexota bacterium]
MTNSNDIQIFLPAKPEIFNLHSMKDRKRLHNLQTSSAVWRTHDTIDQQLKDLVRSRNPQWIKRPSDNVQIQAGVSALLDGQSVEDYGRWVYFPWSGTLVHLLPPDEFWELRLNRNRNKITHVEQEKLAQVTIGVVGLSVGNAVATTLAIEGIGRCLKLADFDHLDLSNMNRIRTSVQDIGLPKTVMCARQIYEMNPYAHIEIFPEGLTETNLGEFFQGDPPLDIVIDECDGIRIKFLLREKARQLGLPVLMETSDRGMLDIERFDLEPNRPLFHGLLGETTSKDIPVGMTNDEKVPFVAPIIGVDTLSARSGASMIEIGETISTWPQLGSEVQLGGATVSAAIRQLVLEGDLTSGRRYIDLTKLITQDDSVTQTENKTDASQSTVTSTPIDMGQPLKSSSISALMHFLVSQAILAPSGGNTQPWKFVTDNEALLIIHDKVQSQSLLDPDHRGAYVGLGAAIQNVCIAAASRGYETTVHYFPNVPPSVYESMSASNEVVAMLQFQLEPAATSNRDALLWPYLATRMTDRKIYDRRVLTLAHHQALLRMTQEQGCHLTLLDGEDTLAEIGVIIGSGDRLRFLQHQTHRELMAEIRWSDHEMRETGDGIDLATMELTATQSIGIQLLRRPEVAQLLQEQNGGTGLAEMSEKAIKNAGAVGLVSVDGSQPADIVQGGRAIQQLWLLATQLGLSLHPMTSLLYMFNPISLKGSNIPDYTPQELATLDHLRQRFNHLFPMHRECSQLMLFRLSYGAPDTRLTQVRSMRRPVEEVLFYEKDVMKLHIPIVDEPSVEKKAVEKIAQSGPVSDGQPCYRHDTQPHRSVKSFYPPPSADLDTPWMINVYSASYERGRWQRYNEAANESYAARGLQAVGEEQHIDIDRYPTYFAEASLDGDTNPIGGVRIHLPDPEGRVPLMDELAGYVDMTHLQHIVSEFLPSGVGHGGGLWIDPAYARLGLAGDLARACNVMIIASGAKSYIAATHQYSLNAWQSLGWTPSPKINPFAYPDERYQTHLLLGRLASWPTDLYAWATKQCDGIPLDESGMRFTVQPMRMYPYADYAHDSCAS